MVTVKIEGGRAMERRTRTYKAGSLTGTLSYQPQGKVTRAWGHTSYAKYYVWMVVDANGKRLRYVAYHNPLIGELKKELQELASG